MIPAIIQTHIKPISFMDILKTKKALPMAEPLLSLRLQQIVGLKIKQQQQSLFDASTRL